MPRWSTCETHEPGLKTQPQAGWISKHAADPPLSRPAGGGSLLHRWSESRRRSMIARQFHSTRLTWDVSRTTAGRCCPGGKSRPSGLEAIATTPFCQFAARLPMLR